MLSIDKFIEDLAESCAKEQEVELRGKPIYIDGMNSLSFRNDITCSVEFSDKSKMTISIHSQ